MAINVLGEAKGHVILFETVVPICPPACEGYNYSSEGDTSAPLMSFAILLVSVVLVVVGKLWDPKLIKNIFLEYIRFCLLLCSQIILIMMQMVHHRWPQTDFVSSDQTYFYILYFYYAFVSCLWVL